MCHKYFVLDSRTALKSLASTTKPRVIRALAKVVVYCKNVADEEEYNSSNEDDEEEEKEENKSELLEMVKDLVNEAKESRVSIAAQSEATFSDKHLMPALNRVLLKNANEEVVYAMIDKFDSNGMKPDFMIGAKLKRKEVYFFFVEVKRPDTSSKYQPEDDYTKLMKQMKNSIDDQFFLGVETPISLGLLVEGFKCSLFQMKLIADGIYMPVAFQRFSLVEEIHQLINIPSIVEGMYFVKCELQKFVVSMNEKRNNEAKKLEESLFVFHFKPS